MTVSRRLSLVLALALLATQALGFSRLSARAAQEGVEGNTYTSPTYGWSISWNDDWEVVDEISEDGYDELIIDDSLSWVYFESYEDFGGDATACVEEEQADLEAQEGVSDIEVGTSARGDDLAGGDEEAAYTVYTFTFTSEDGVETPLVEYSDCRTLVPGEAVLEISQITSHDAYNDAAPIVQDLLAGLAMPGEVPVDQPDENTGDEDSGQDQNPEDLTSDDVKSLAEQASEDVVEFWTEVFDDHDMFYVSPFFEIIEDESQAPCSEGAVHPGVGSFYCGLNQTVYFDLESEASDAQVGGIASPIYTIGHESGHDVQMQLGIMISDTLSVEKELEADCMAGAFMAWEIEKGAMTEEDFFVNLDLVEALGDPAGTPATHPQAHGMGSQRVSMVLRGYYNGVDACGTFPK